MIWFAFVGNSPLPINKQIPDGYGETVSVLCASVPSFSYLILLYAKNRGRIDFKQEFLRFQLPDLIAK